MRQLVERKLIEALKARGKNKSSLSSEEFKNAIDAAVEKNRDVLYAKAKEIVMMQTAEIDLAL